MSLWTKWMRTTLLSSLVMYSMLSRLITLSPTRSILLMVHLLPPKSRAGTPRRIPRPGGRRDRAEAEGGACCKEVVSAPQILATLPLSCWHTRDAHTHAPGRLRPSSPRYPTHRPAPLIAHLPPAPPFPRAWSGVPPVVVDPSMR